MSVSSVTKDNCVSGIAISADLGPTIQREVSTSFKGMVAANQINITYYIIISSKTMLFDHRPWKLVETSIRRLSLPSRSAAIFLTNHR